MTLKASYSYAAMFIMTLSSTSKSSHLNSFYLNTKSSGKASLPFIILFPPGNILFNFFNSNSDPPNSFSNSL
jgi:hypothetical protein